MVAAKNYYCYCYCYYYYEFFYYELLLLLLLLWGSLRPVVEVAKIQGCSTDRSKPDANAEALWSREWACFLSTWMYLHAYIYIYISTYIYICLYTCIRTCMHAGRQAYIHSIDILQFVCIVLCDVVFHFTVTAFIRL